MEINGNFSGKSPPADSGQLLLVLWAHDIAVSLCASEQLPCFLTGFQLIPLRQDTRHVSGIMLRRHGLLQRFA